MASTQARSTSGSIAHVNIMTDTIVANLPVDGLRIVVRSLLVSHSEITSTFDQETRRFVEQRAAVKHAEFAENISKHLGLRLSSMKEAQKLVRCMLGSGLCFQSLPLLGQLVWGTSVLALQINGPRDDDIYYLPPSIDADVVQAVTAIQKTLIDDTGMRSMTDAERKLVQDLHQKLESRKHEHLNHWNGKHDLAFSRGLAAIADLLGAQEPHPSFTEHAFFTKYIKHVPPPAEARETFQLGTRKLPRIFSGLWQMSSAAWGAPPMLNVLNQISKYAEAGFTAFDMADHYGDAELMFGTFWSSYPYKETLFTATKYCVFRPMKVGREGVQANVTERCQRVHQNRIDLLQFHWQFYDDPQYLDALRYLAEDTRVGMIGLCNFDTAHLQRVLDSGILHIHTNQVQFSLIDSRPTAKMGEVCQKHNIKLLTYGTLCGGFLADKWLDMPEPNLYDPSITPSQRKYHEMILSWGDWTLFQDLLQELKSIAVKHRVSISSVATRWVLDFPYVGAVIVGARMGISEHIDANEASLGWSLDRRDRKVIEGVLARSRREEMFERMGDCGAEYRS